MPSSIRLGVNVDHVATVRQARLTTVPDPIQAARICRGAGADSVVCHLREDRRHIQDDDVRRLVRDRRLHVNLEMSMAPAIVAVALRLKPFQVTLVPEHRRELTTEGGLDVRRARPRLRRLVPRFQRAGIAVSLFVDPVPAQLAAAAATGATLVELHTGQYAQARTIRQRRTRLAQLANAARIATARGFSVAAGHGLDYRNVGAIARIPEIEELNIGFAIIARAIFVGLEQAVREMTALLRR